MVAKHRAGLGAFDTCRACGSARPTAVFDGESTNFLCEECHSCWLVTIGWVARVNPLTCVGCPRREECVSAFAARTVHSTERAPNLADADQIVAIG